MDRNEKLRGFLREIQECINEGREYIFNSTMLGPDIQIEDMPQANQLDQVINLARQRQTQDTLIGERIGVVDPKIPDSLSIGNLSRGEIVLFREQGEGLLSVSIPYSPTLPEDPNPHAVLLQTHTTRDIPRRYIRPIGPAQRISTP